ncbi:hypothetical protein [uncultured Succinatimonas sp.]|uniref:hypothetical protein n=2 Tax=uncultured Succinatimonas sp. TaxID=1262973 RepID=UPI00261DF9F2|nr:hypothetical protein [uncultured Succinatimonas sp.]
MTIMIVKEKCSMRNYRSDIFKQGLKPLYIDLLNQSECVLDKNQYSVFCLQWGKEFPEEKHKGILFVGRSVNGWRNNEIGEVDLLFGDKESYEKTCKPIFDVHD